METSIAIIGMACRYPDAATPQELWENVLAGRRAFRRIPDTRLRREDYYSADPDAADRTYAAEAAVIEGYEFDRVRFRVAGSTYRSADLVHWLALDIADQALTNAGFPGGEGLPRTSTGVILGNTLTGEFSRAGVMRLRWPYVRRVVKAALMERGSLLPEEQVEFLDHLEQSYKSPFPTGNEETLAGGLANTIAGRICNYFDLHGGGYTVDGACASSLLAVTNACMALTANDLDVALAGGVDLSIDPFELVGFARTHALATDEMRVYDVRSSGFWPGEGCGVVVLMRLADAVAQGRRILATIRGWGVSSDGNGGITRPEVDGQLLALRRAYRRADCGAETVGYFEGHGTGTSVGDAVELQALTRIRREGTQDGPPAAIGSIKANIGHTKAAAGLAGLIKAVMALQTRILPPMTACDTPRPELVGADAALYAPAQGALWHQTGPLRAGVSAMGFGGINTHLVLENRQEQAGTQRTELTPTERRQLCSAQDAELFLLAADDWTTLRQHAEEYAVIASQLSRAELTDFAAYLAHTTCTGFARAALVASTPNELARLLKALCERLASGEQRSIDPAMNLFFGGTEQPPRIGFLFPGQGSPAHTNGGAWQRRFEAVHHLYKRVTLPHPDHGNSTAFAQPAIMTASLASLAVLERMGIQATLAIGHSLGELTALHWAGAWDEATALRIASARGKAMSELGPDTGVMCCIHADAASVQPLIEETPIVIAGYNSSRQTVLAGDAKAMEIVISRARHQKLNVTPLPVAHAFHSPLVAGAVPVLAQCLARETTQSLKRRVCSTVTGRELPQDIDISALLLEQITAPVRFQQAFTAASAEIDLWIEVGPGSVLTGLTAGLSHTPAAATNVGASGVKDLLGALGAAYALGADIHRTALFADRFTRPYDPQRRLRFFVNPCELAPTSGDPPGVPTALPPVPVPMSDTPPTADLRHQAPSLTALDCVRRLVAERAELPLTEVRNEDRLLSDLHLNSISVSQIAVEAARQLQIPPPIAPMEFANATVGEMARALSAAPQSAVASVASRDRTPTGIDVWVHAFTPRLKQRSLIHTASRLKTGAWDLLSPEGHPLALALATSEPAVFTLNALQFPTAPAGVVVCLPSDLDERSVGLLLQGARRALAQPAPATFVVVQQNGGGAGFARTLYLEHPEIDVAVLDLPLDHPHAPEWLMAELREIRGYTEAHYDTQGTRYEPYFERILPDAVSRHKALGPGDVLLITGGGKGIAAECGLSLARETGARLALLGRSHPDADTELASNLERMQAAGICLRYLNADVTDAEEVRNAVRRAETELGPITAILHSAGSNTPCLISELNEAAFLRTLAPKIQGARNLLSAVDLPHLRLFVTFGSLIARTGLPGEADYATANEWLTCLTERLQQENPHCRFLAVEWSVWAGAGMAERMGQIDALMRKGITPIPIDTGVRILHKLLDHTTLSGAVVVTGRHGNPLTLCHGYEDLPLRRFLERPRVYTAGVELIADVDLSIATDPYLKDHVYAGNCLFPGVVGLEAMAQAAMAVQGEDRPPVFEDVAFLRPIVVTETRNTTIRVMALAVDEHTVSVAIRCESSGFQADHFRAICRFKPQDESALPASASAIIAPGALPELELEPKRDLYGSVLFQSGRFQRLCGYRMLRAAECIAEIEPQASERWFGSYLPADLILGDLAAHDATIHAIQACIPHATLLPVAVERVIPDTRDGCIQRFISARERSHQGDLYVYDIDVLNAQGEITGRWEGLQLRAIPGTTPLPGPWAVPLLAPLITRRLQGLLPCTPLKVALERVTGMSRRERSEAAVRRAMGNTAALLRRPDGRPELAEIDIAVSTAHAGSMTLAVIGPGPLSCDLEPVQSRPEGIWRDMLGPERHALAALLSRESGEDVGTASTRVWSAGECLVKIGCGQAAPLILERILPDGWALLKSGKVTIATWVTALRGCPEPISVAILMEEEHAHL